MAMFSRPVTKTRCIICRKVFWAERSKVLRGARKCCSKSCRGIAARRAQPKHQGRKPEHGGCVGGAVTRLYRIWAGIKRRCHCPTFTPYGAYGARRIRMCREWRMSFAAFQQWALEHGYKDNLQCDRRKNHLGYFPGNCRWVTSERNCANRRNSIILPTGETTTQAAKRLGISAATIRNRLSRMKLTPTQAAMMPKLLGGRIKQSYYRQRLRKWKDE